MPVIHESIRINRPVQDVFAFATKPENTLLYSSNMLSYEPDGPLAKGARIKGASKVAGRQVDWVTEVIEWDPSRTYMLRSLEAPMGFTVEWKFEDVSNSETEVTFHQEVDELGGFFGKLGDALVTRMYSRDVKSNLTHLRELLEDE